jgi:hypothetical protein
VLVHCSSGKDRTGMFLSYYLCATEGMAPSRAIQEIRRVRRLRCRRRAGKSLHYKCSVHSTSRHSPGVKVVSDLLIVARGSLFQLPLLLLATIGLWFAVSRRRRYPRPCRLASYGFVLLAACAFMQVGIQGLLAVSRNRGPSQPNAGELVTQVNLMSLGAYLLLMPTTTARRRRADSSKYRLQIGRTA